jgi:hypothetical protein
MDQQQTAPRQRDPAPVAAGAGRDHWLTTETVGRERFRLLLQQWLKRNSWSLAVTSRLSELALLAQADAPVPDWSAGMPLKAGDWVNHRGHAWEALGSPLSEPVEGDPGWAEVGLTSRLHASGMNLFLRNKNRTLTSTFFLEVGRLNEWVAAVQKGDAAAPQEPRLQELVLQADVILDEEGVFGPEEMLSIATGRLMPPNLDGASSAAADQSSSGVPARQLRAAAAAAGLDIIDDWPEIAGMYPSTDPARLERLQQVLRGIGSWDPDQEEDERVASLVLLQALEQRCAQRAAATKELPPAEGLTTTRS